MIVGSLMRKKVQAIFLGKKLCADTEACIVLNNHFRARARFHESPHSRIITLFLLGTCRRFCFAWHFDIFGNAHRVSGANFGSRLVPKSRPWSPRGCFAKTKLRAYSFGVWLKTRFIEPCFVTISSRDRFLAKAVGRKPILPPMHSRLDSVILNVKERRRRRRIKAQERFCPALIRSLGHRLIARARSRPQLMILRCGALSSMIGRRVFRDAGRFRGDPGFRRVPRFPLSHFRVVRPYSTT